MNGNFFPDKQAIPMVNIDQLIQIATQAGNIILSVYHQSTFETMNKNDNSFLTEADLKSHDYIISILTTLYPSIPVISEEADDCSYEVRQKWDQFFLVDPLDGTKEFIHRNDEFTVNIAFIEKNQPTMGVIHAPALEITYYAEKGVGAYKIMDGISTKLLPLPTISIHHPIRVAISRSHCCKNTEKYINAIKMGGKDVTTIAKGSALKFGLIAEGMADIYPRFSPTMEWDTAAGHAIINEVGKKITLVDSETVLQYNKISLLNPGFIVK